MRKKNTTNNIRIGTLSVNIHGFGFVEIEGGSSLFIPAPFINGALSGDTVEATLLPDSDPARPTGSIRRILARRFNEIIGCVAISKRGEYFLRPMRKELPQTIPLYGKDGGTPQCAAGDWAKATLPIPHECSAETRQSAILADVIGACGDITADLDAIVAEFALPEPYSEEDCKRASHLRPTKVTRLDYTGKCTVTIDPVDARDFDDALSCERQRGTGRLVVAVHIADVACYIHNGTRLDHEARRRGFTSYLPGRTLPMIPRTLSDDLCCLRAGVPRLAHTVFMTIDEHTGEILSYRRRHCTIMVTQRLNYDQVQDYFDGRPFEAEPGVLEMLDRLRDLSRVMRARRRREEQFLPMEMPEIRALCSEHPPKVIGVRAEEESPSHQLVEEFMLAANQCIAEELLALRLPGLFRNHQAPDAQKLNAFVEAAMMMTDMKIGHLSARHNVVSFLRRAAQSPLRDVLYMTFLRHLPRADYGEECLGHYGLGKEHYCHFTSPIRRYPDTLVHQQLLAYDLRRTPYDLETVAALGQQCSALEYNCSQAEFAAQDRLKIRLIDERRRQEENFTLMGEICRTTKNSVQVYLPEYGLMAYVNEDQLPASRWSFDTRRCVWRNLNGEGDMAIAMAIPFQVVDADPVRGELALRPARAENRKGGQDRPLSSPRRWPHGWAWEEGGDTPDDTETQEPLDLRVKPGDAEGARPRANAAPPWVAKRRGKPAFREPLRNTRKKGKRGRR